MRLALALLALSLVGCGSTRPQPMSGMLVLGTTAVDGTGFLALEGEQPLVGGAQGGFHVWLKYRVQGMSPGKVRIERTARRVSDNRLLLTTTGTQEIGDASEDGFWELPTAIPSFMCPTPLGVKVEDQPAVFNVKIFTVDGALITESTAEATPRCPTDDQAEFCHRICNG